MQPIPATVPSDANALPPELLETPQPVIGFAGLDCTKNITHKSIWDAFNTNRKADRAAIQFKLLTTNYELPVVKPKRQSYEWYHPKGILKRNWILKHLHVVPSIIVLFQDLDWNDAQWTEKQYQCVSMIQAIKTSIQGRHTKLAIVLLQRNGNADEPFSGERLSTLATKCDINQKMIFVLPYNDNLMGYTLRLESAFLEQAQSYYMQSAKHVRMHRDQLTSSHQELKIRHQFKLGFYAEMRVDLNTALKHLNQAYEWLEEIRMVDSNCLEIKVISGFLNYKICKLMFNIGSPRDAITQFRTHIDKYRNRVGSKDLYFEHFAWLSVQYSAFADLFCDAIKCGLPALQTQHPGIYYHKSAEYMSKRKEAFQQYSQASSPLIDFLPLADQNALNFSNILYSDYFGVRGGNRTELVNEQQITSIVQESEKYFNHSTAYITLLGQAMAQFKIYKCPRFRKKLAIEMAEEYLKIGDASKALTLYSLMLSEYRNEKWNIVFTQVLLKTLRSAFLSASVPDFIACSIESLSKKIVMDRSERIVILENLWKVFQKVPPLAQTQIVPELHFNWEKALEAFNTKLSFDLDKIIDLFDYTVEFSQPKISHCEVVQVNVFLRSISDVPIKVQEFVIHVSDGKTIHKMIAQKWSEQSEQSIADAEDRQNIDSDVMIQPDTLYKISFSGDQYQFNENSELHVIRLEIKIGTLDNCITLFQNQTASARTNFKSYKRLNDSLSKTKDCSKCYIIPLFHLKMESTLSHPFMLTNEVFSITIRVENNFDILIENVSVIVTVPPQFHNKLFIVSDSIPGRHRLLSQNEMIVGDLEPKASRNLQVKVISLIVGTLELKQTVRYQVEKSNSKSIVDGTEYGDKETNNKSIVTKMRTNQISLEYVGSAVLKSKSDTIIIPCTAEFEFSGQFLSLNKELISRAVKYEDFLFQVQLDVKSVDIEILDMFLITDYNITEKPYGKQRRKNNKLCRQGEIVQDVKLLHAEETTQDWIDRTQYQQKTLNNREFCRVKPYSSSTMENFNVKGAANGLFDITKKFQNKLNTSDAASTDNLSQQFQQTTLIDDHFANPDTVVDSMAIDTVIEPKTVYNHTIDAFTLVENRRGFLNAKPISLHDINLTDRSNQHIGMYCVRWRRVGESNENETKLIVNCIDIIQAPLNIYCYLDEKMYVKVPMTLVITLKNTTNATLHFKSYLKNADNFMFAGHSQFNISLFAKSTHNLVFNLYPLKAGWQDLPEFIISYNTNANSTASQTNDALNNDLQKLVDRWMPKKVFILPMVKQI